MYHICTDTGIRKFFVANDESKPELEEWLKRAAEHYAENLRQQGHVVHITHVPR